MYCLIYLPSYPRNRRTVPHQGSPLNERYQIRDMTGIEFGIVGVMVEKRKRY